MRYFIRCSAILLLFGVGTVIAQGQNPCQGGWGPCFGRDCPGGYYQPCQSSGLGCYCGEIAGPCRVEPDLADLEIAIMSATPLQAPAGGGLVGAGAVLTLELQNDVEIPVRHSSNWGNGNQTIPVPAGALQLTVQVGTADPATPTILPFTVVSLTGTLGSFNAVALRGAETGTNSFSLRGPSSGFIDLSAGEFSVNLLAQFFNTVFGSEPAELDAVLSGAFDENTGQVTLPLEPANVFVTASAP